MTVQQLDALLAFAPSYNIHKTLMVMRNKLELYRRVAVSYSGGSDSDIMLDLIELVKPENCGVIKYVFFDTGLEWDATLRHITRTEQYYGVEIERRKAKVTIPVACTKHGIPFLTKHVSEMIGRLQKHNFDWTDTIENATVENYGNCVSGLNWYFDRVKMKKEGARNNYSITKHRLLKEFMTANPPDFPISDKCCDYAKKNVANEFDKEFNPDLKIIGMRQAEGGRRVGRIKNCFSPPDENKSHAEYLPLWFWSDDDKQKYKQWRGVLYSDCYELWGFTRTGCVGCPCASLSVEQLEYAKQYEPKKVKAAYYVFGAAYEYREKYNQFKAGGN